MPYKEKKWLDGVNETISPIFLGLKYLQIPTVIVEINVTQKFASLASSFSFAQNSFCSYFIIEEFHFFFMNEVRFRSK